MPGLHRTEGTGSPRRRVPGDAPARWPSPPLAERPQQLPRLRAPDGAGPRPRARRDPAAADPAPGRRAGRRARPRARALAPGAAARARPRHRRDRARGGRRRGDGRGDEARCRRDPPGHVHGRQLARGGGLPAEGPRAVGARRLLLRAGRRQARDAPEAVRDLPAAVLRGDDGAGAGARARARARGPRHRRDALVPPARLPGLRGPRPGALLPRRCRPTARARRRRTRTPSSTAPTATGGRAAATAGATTTTSRSSPGSRARRRSGSRRRGSAASPSSPTCRPAPRCPGSPRRRSPGCASRPGCRSLSRGSDEPLHELLAGGPGRGFARLPPPSEGDVFFDIEGDPYWGERAWSTCSARSPRTATSRCGRTTARRSGPRSSAGSTGSRRAWSATPTCTSTTTTTTSRRR